MEMLENVATPLDAGTGFVPDSVPPPGLVPMASVIDAAEPVTVLSLESCTVTGIEGLMLTPAVAFDGCTVNASLEAAPGVMLNALLVAEARPPELAISV